MKFRFTFESYVNDIEESRRMRKHLVARNFFLRDLRARQLSPAIVLNHLVQFRVCAFLSRGCNIKKLTPACLALSVKKFDRLFGGERVRKRLEFLRLSPLCETRIRKRCIGASSSLHSGCCTATPLETLNLWMIYVWLYIQPVNSLKAT